MVARTSEAEKRVRGTYRPSRALTFPPGAEVGPPPARLEPELKTLWIEVAGNVPKGVASRADREGFELLVRLLAKVRGGRFGAADAMQAKALLSAFAMLPDSPRRAAIVPPAPLNKLERFLADGPMPRPRKGLDAFRSDDD